MLVIRKVSPVEAQQVVEGEPLPLGVEPTETGALVCWTRGGYQPVPVGHWVLYHETGADVLAPSAFAAQYEPASEPAPAPTPEG